MKSKAYLEEIRRAEGLSRAVLKKIVLERDRVIFYLVTDCTYSQADCEYAREVTQRYVPEGCRAEVSVLKSVPGAEGVRRAVLEFLKEKFPAAAAFVSPDDIEIIMGEGGGRFVIGVAEAERTQFVRENVLDAVASELNRQFCGVWYGDCRASEKAREALDPLPPPPAEISLAPRTFPVTEYCAVDGANPRFATYIADLSREAQNVAVCGTITYLEERLTKNGKPYFLISLSDGSGILRTSYFSRKATVEKIRAFRVGDRICLTGDYELYQGNFSFRAKTADYGAPPEGFVPEARPGLPVPACYSAVFPEFVSDSVQANLFEEKSLPPDFLAGSFVVLDLETTGLGNNAGGGLTDRIIEVGAVKIVNGEIREKFSSFVSCPVRLSAEIIALTGIQDEMLLGAPEIGTVIADFYKFCDGCPLVGHNIQFDYKFIHFYGEQTGYRFDRKLYDTLSFSQQVLRLSNYKLNTVADHFGFRFHHHRAFDDAFVTAKIFVELVRLNGGLPD